LRRGAEPRSNSFDDIAEREEEEEEEEANPSNYGGDSDIETDEEEEEEEEAETERNTCGQCGKLFKFREAKQKPFVEIFTNDILSFVR
jgi:hypothetical protein